MQSIKTSSFVRSLEEVVNMTDLLVVSAWVDNVEEVHRTNARIVLREWYECDPAFKLI